MVPIEIPDDFAVSEYRGGERMETAPVHERSSPPRERLNSSVYRIPESKLTVIELIRELRDSLGSYILIVTHYMASILAIATNGVFLDAESLT